jgi:ATP-dependent protease ClpP protease subunit
VSRAARPGRPVGLARLTPAELARLRAFRQQTRAAAAQGRRNWYRIRNAAGAAGDTAEVYLYDEISLWGVTAAAFVDELRAITAPNIALHINSPGGDVFDGLAIHACLQAHPATVTTHVDGLAASAASFIAQAGDQVLIARNAVMMIHDAAGLCWGNAGDMRELADLLDKLSDNIADVYAARAGGTVADWRARMRAETWYTGAEAVDAGLADALSNADSGSGPTDRAFAAARDRLVRQQADRAAWDDIVGRLTRCDPGWTDAIRRLAG